MELLSDPAIAAEIRRAWKDSCPDDPANRHEEGGYIVMHTDLSPSVERWPRGEQSRVVPPPLTTGNRYNGNIVVAAFHTHPNPPIDEVGDRWDQDPSESDKRWHRRRNLPGYVISRESVYKIDHDSNVHLLGKHDEVLST